MEMSKKKFHNICSRNAVSLAQRYGAGFHLSPMRIQRRWRSVSKRWEFSAVAVCRNGILTNSNRKLTEGENIKDLPSTMTGPR
jgi:hypothetical protein